MKSAIRSLIIATTLLVLPPLAMAQDEAPRIQLAILLDTSGSMEGLIDQARTQLWKIVNEFATAERAGRRPDLEVALYEYGKSALASEEGYIRMILPLTTDLDRLSEELFALTTNGGDEYCGWVIRDAVEELAWSDAPSDLKAIFIAGNEPFTQGGVDHRTSCRSAIARGIMVNTIHCGSYEDGVSGSWKEGALLADGEYLNIDHNRDLVHIDAPQDAEIAQLGEELNRTYIPFGSFGTESVTRQEAQDALAEAAAPAVASERAVFKASAHYKNAAWDLVDAVREGEIVADDLDEEELPAVMQGMTGGERQAYIEANAKKRAELQERIRALSEERKTFVAEKMREEANEGDATFDRAVIEIIRQQASARQFVIE